MEKFFSFSDVKDQYKSLLNQALEHKKNPFGSQHLGKNKTIGLIFFNPSLRTRLSSIKAAYNLGAQVWVLNAGSDSWTLEMGDGTIMDGNTQEHIKEAIQVMSAYCDVLGVRTFPNLKNREEDYNELIFNKVLAYSSVPVVSLESATLHPLQSFADLITIAEHKKTERVKVALTWAPHVRALPQAVPNSFADWFSEIDFVDFVIAHPEGYELDEKFTKGAKITQNQNEALEGADFVYAKNWSSYSDYGQILSKDSSWMITEEKMKLTNDGKFMHCLPVRRNVVVADEVLDSPRSIVIAEATNRIFSAQTIFGKLLEN
jgi:N-succinyl-L-ornithine transcarbamylase